MWRRVIPLSTPKHTAPQSTLNCKVTLSPALPEGNFRSVRSFHEHVAMFGIWLGDALPILRSRASPANVSRGLSCAVCQCDAGCWVWACGFPAPVSLPACQMPRLIDSFAGLHGGGCYWVSRGKVRNGGEWGVNPRLHGYHIFASCLTLPNYCNLRCASSLLCTSPSLPRICTESGFLARFGYLPMLGGRVGINEVG